MNPIKIAIPVTSMPVDNYTRAVEAQGATPVVYHTVENLNADDFDALLLPGGGDLNPKLYGQEMNGSMEPEAELDELQVAFLKAALDAGKPIFGICRGHQLLHAYFGGTLIQDIPNASKHARDVLTGPDKHHDAYVSGPDSYLKPIYGDVFRINSSHHQVVDKLGEGFVVDQYSCDDQWIEASHHTSLPIWTTQWHPERCHATEEQPDEVDGYKVLAFFVDQVRSTLN